MKLNSRAFSLVEVLAAVAIIGIIVFLALPNVIQAKLDTEEQMVITRAEALNMSISAYITANGRSNAGVAWAHTDNSTHGAKYLLVKGYMAYAPSTLAATSTLPGYQPNGYTFEFGTLDQKVVVKRGSTVIPY